MNKYLVLLLLPALMACCAAPPKPAPPTSNPFYQINTDLAAKAAAHRTATIAMIDSGGMLCYRGAFPWGGDQRGLSNYLQAHNIADAPAWHGMLMQAFALEWAAGGQNSDALLGRMADALSACSDITGTPGLLGRSWIADYVGPRLSWMVTQEQRPTKYWLQGTGNRWYRNGCAKNHWNMAAGGCGLTLALHRAGEIVLSDATRDKLVGVLVSMVKHLRDGGWRIIDADGEPTEYGDLRPDVAFGPTWPEVGLPNGFNRMIVLAALRSASHYDAGLLADYNRLASSWADGIPDSMVAVGIAVSAIGHDRLGKPSYSDMQAFAAAAFVFLQQEDDPDLVAQVNGALDGLWRYMKHENNPPFSLAYSLGHAGAKIGWVVRLLRHFPGRDGKRAYSFTKKDSSHYQPIENRPPNSQYWKSSPFRLALTVDTENPATNPETGDPMDYAGADYLLAYWMWRFLGGSER